MKTRILIALMASVYLSHTYAATFNSISDFGSFKTIEAATSSKAKFDKDNQLVRMTIPRDDINFTLNGIKYSPAIGLSSWLEFKKENNDLTVSGDLVLTENQVNAVMSSALKHNIQVTALETHSMWEEPRVMYMHITSTGTPEQINKNIAQLFSDINATKDIKNSFPIAGIDPENTPISGTELNAKDINHILRAHGELKDGVYKVALGQTTNIPSHNANTIKGVNTWVAMTGTTENAVMDGSIAVHEYQLQKVLLTLRKANIDVLAIDDHSDHNNQDYVLVHFYGLGHATALIKTVRKALNIADIEEKMAVAKKHEQELAELKSKLKVAYCSTDGITTNIFMN